MRLIEAVSEENEAQREEAAPPGVEAMVHTDTICIKVQVRLGLLEISRFHNSRISFVEIRFSVISTAVFRRSSTET